MFSRFSPAARRVLRAAEQECRNHNHYYVGAEHLLEALLAEHDRAILAALDSKAIDSRAVHAEVHRSIDPDDDRVWEGILLTPRVRKIVAVAEAAAVDREIEPFDLFEALRAEGGSLAAEILRRAAAPRNPATATE